MVGLQIPDGWDCLQIRRITVNTLNAQSRNETRNSLTEFGFGTRVRSRKDTNRTVMLRNVKYDREIDLSSTFGLL
jgi:hypothetical protein